MDLYSKVLSEIETKVEEGIRKVQSKSLSSLKRNALSSRVPMENTLSVKIPQDFTQAPLVSPNQAVSSLSFANKHVLSVQMFNKDQLNDIFNLAQTLRVFVLKQRPLDHILKVWCGVFRRARARTPI